MSFKFEVAVSFSWQDLPGRRRLDGCDKTPEIEREAGELAAIFATIAMKVERRLEAEAASRRKVRIEARTKIKT